MSTSFYVSDFQSDRKQIHSTELNNNSDKYKYNNPNVKFIYFSHLCWICNMKILFDIGR